MALGTPSSAPEAQENIQLSNESQAKVDTIARNAVAVLDKNPDAQSAIANLFGEMVSKNLRNPENITKIQNGLYEARDSRLAGANPSERLSILEWFSKFMEKFTQWIAQMNRDVGLSNDANQLKSWSDMKISQVQSTYAQILTNSHPTQTA
jgi:hypothetical protein